MTDQSYYVIDNKSREKNDIVIFVRDAMPGEWRSCAIEMRDSAELLWNDRNNALRAEVSNYTEVEDGKLCSRTETKKVYSMSRPYLLLAGFAIENLMKGFLVACDPSLINKGELNNELKTHKLTSLADKIDGLTLKENEKKFCEVADSAIPYWGRYPVPLAYNQVVPEVGLDDKLRLGFLSLFDRIDKKLYMKICDGWDSGAGAKSVKIYDAKYHSEERPDDVFGSKTDESE